MQCHNKLTLAIHSASLYFEFLIIAPIKKLIDWIKINGKRMTNTRNWHNYISEIRCVKGYATQVLFPC